MTSLSQEVAIIPKQTFCNLREEKRDRIFTAALNEFSSNSFDESKLSNIIREAQIPRGSFYQYFDNKLDLYRYVFNTLGEKKISYMSDILLKQEETPFLVLFKELYIIGLKFAVDNPLAVKMMKFLFASHGYVYDEIMQDGLIQAKQFYIGFIEADKKAGRIHKSIDSDVLADMFINLINNISFEEFSRKGENLDYDKMFEKFEKILYILEKGILIGERNV